MKIKEQAIKDLDALKPSDMLGRENRDRHHYFKIRC